MLSRLFILFRISEFLNDNVVLTKLAVVRVSGVLKTGQAHR